MKRKKVSKKTSNKIFAATVSRTNSKNVKRVPRGGERY